eukprot:5515272-Prymnesium_polylepis.1
MHVPMHADSCVVGRPRGANPNACGRVGIAIQSWVARSLRTVLRFQPTSKPCPTRASEPSCTRTSARVAAASAASRKRGIVVRIDDVEDKFKSHTTSEQLNISNLSSGGRMHAKTAN